MKSRYDKLFFISLLPVAVILIGILILILYTVFSMSLESVEVFGLELFTRNAWDPESEVYGVLSPIVGTFVTSSIAALLALTLSIPLSIFLAEFVGGRLRDLLSSFIELMSGIPTVVYAVWALNSLAPFMKDYIMLPLHEHLGVIPVFSCRPLSGLSILTAGVAIGVALVPYISSLILEAYKFIPLTYREACLSIGASRYETVKILLSLAKPAIIASTMLGFARAAGETTIAAVVVGNSVSLSPCIFAPGYTVPALIASQYGNAALYRYAEPVLYAASSVVLITTLLLSFMGLNMVIRWRSRVVV